MSETKTDLELVVESLVEEGRARLGPEPEVAELLAYHRGELSEEETERFQERLAHFPDAAQLLAAFTAEGEPQPGDPDYLSEEDGAALWEGLQERVAGPAPGAVTVEMEEVRQRRTEGGTAPTGRRLAAAAGWVLAAVVVGALGPMLYLEHQRNEVLGQHVRELREPRVDLERRSISPTRARRGPATEDGVQLPPREGPYLLTLSFFERPPFPEYRLEIVDLDDPEAPAVWIQTGVEIAAGSTIPLYLPGDFLPPGRYEIRLYGVDGGSEEPVATFSVVV